MRVPASPLMKASLSRRRLLAATGVGLGATFLSACTGSGEGGETRSEMKGVQFWHQLNPLWVDPVVEASAKEQDVKIDVQAYPAPDLMKSLQLGRRNSQLPDVHTIHTVLLGPASALIDDGWFQPIDEFVDLAGTPTEKLLMPGVHVFDGKVYSFPVVDSRFHEATPWVVTEGMEDIDPADVETWDGFRAACRKMTNGDTAAIAFGTKDYNYPQTKLKQLASTAGATHYDGVDFTTGEYVWDSQPFVDAFEFILSMHQDGVFHPSSTSMAVADAGQRWAVGETRIDWGGPWVPGTVAKDFPELAEQGLAVWRVPTAEKTRAPIHVGPPTGTFWLSASADEPERGAEAMAAFTAPEVAVAVANTMAAPPLDLEAVKAASDASDVYRQNVEWMQEDVRYAPSPDARNADVGKVYGAMQAVAPTPGEILAGAIAGEIDDWKQQLTDFVSGMSSAREKAIEKVNSDGGEVSLDDWVFADWKPADDYNYA